MSPNETIVFFDLQTTGFGKQCHITQLSAVCGEGKFKKFILPWRPIDKRATKLTGFTISDDLSTLFLNGRRVDTVCVSYALKCFIRFLGSCCSGHPHRPVLLAAHCVKQFGKHILTRLLLKFSLWHRFKRVVSGFVDTFPLSKELYPDLLNHQHKTLVEHCLGDDYIIPKPKEATTLQDLFNSWTQQFGSLDRYLHDPKIFQELQKNGHKNKILH
ncbi:uncharacterized protein LOC125886949 isoform X2 [Epinephelus fuscoguttatus]|uniref:uncharacterized protein LOC125886949 isoform X2 n=1 Tax=Epinephelus fuscoguttatus TaxID=293821 RepID=UPI0020D1BF04|nr:uncharacterized protein LOC125886949 isoform X2 [Epinephelus fuscoguttatus]